MLEKHRLAYLDVFGIDNYMPRYVLPNALSSQLLSDDALQVPEAFSTADIPVESIAAVDNHAANNHAVSQVQVADTVTPAANELMQSLGINTTPEGAAPTESKPSAPTPTASDAAVTEKGLLTSSEREASERDASNLHTQSADTQPVDIRFSLNIWRIREELIVIDSRQPASALPTDKLLQNILRSIGFPLVQLPASELLRWPLFANKKIAGIMDSSSEEEEARAMVQAYLSAQYAKAPVKALLLLGQDATQFALTPTHDEGNAATAREFYQANKGSAVSSIWDSCVLVAPSLADMLNDPMEKRTTWQALQILLASNDDESLPS